MKRFLLFIIICCCGSGLCAQPILPNSKSKIYLVRHGEKETGNDPGLTLAGKIRAGDLMRKLKNKHIRHIYVSQYRRTQMTGDSMRIQLGIDTIHYLADTTGIDLVNKIVAHNDMRRTILVVGHSNTIPKLIRKLGVMNYPQENIADEAFDNLFLVRYKKHKAHVGNDKYGKASGVSASMH